MLPGLEQVRNHTLDNLCEGIGEERHLKDGAKVKEERLTVAALQQMRQTGVQVYRHAGVELARVPGAEKVRVRLVQGQGDPDARDRELVAGQVQA